MHASLRLRWYVVLISLAVTPTVSAQLQITEILYDSVQDAGWEWIEVRNAGATPLDLDGYFYGDISEPALTEPNIISTGSGGMSPNTIVPAGGVAVLFNGSSLSFSEARFRSAWQLNAGIPLIAVRSPPALNNGGDSIGLWRNLVDYNNDLGDPDMDGIFSVVQFTNAQASVDYNMGFPTGTQASIFWNGTGNYQDGAQWARSMDGANGATTSVPTFLTGLPINNVADVGNPGAIPAGPLRPGVSISEVMFDPRSAEPGWEWFEVVNNTGSPIDFSATPYFFDDASTGQINSANVTSGMIGQGGVAILFNSSEITLQDMQTAWGAGNNYIPVTNWQGLNNSGGDTVALWDDATEYQTDRTNGVFTNAVAAVSYVEGTNGWPVGDGNGSFYLSTSNGDPTVGANWLLSAPGDGISANAQPVIATQPDHLGGDVASPGVFGMTTVSGDFNNDGMYDCQDINALTAEIAAGTNGPTFDLTGDGAVNLLDRDAWLAEAGENNLGAGRAYRLGDANLDSFVDGSDFGIWNSNKFTSATAWCLGNFNADSFVDGSDFGVWNSNKFTSADGAAVPEPTGSALCWLLAAVWCILMRQYHIRLS